MENVLQSHSIHLSYVFNPESLKSTVNGYNKALLKLMKQGVEVQALAFTGNSGAAVAYPLSAIYGWPIICVRKGEPSHGQLVEAPNGHITSYVIVDDCIDTGNTVNNIRRALNGLICKAIILLFRGWHTSGSFYDIPVYSIE